MTMQRAIQLKEDGNRCFQSGNYTDAEGHYSNAIDIDRTNPLLFTNRAMARLKLLKYDKVISDCNASLELLRDNMKAYYYLAQAEIELGRVEEASNHADEAYDLCSGRKTGTIDQGWLRSLSNVTALVLRCRKEKWEKKENERQKVQNTLLEEVCSLVKAKKEEQLERIAAENGPEEDMDDIESEWVRKEQELRRMWNIAVDAEAKRGVDIVGKRRDVPDWLIDNITFQVMHDPMMTKTGQSYERASILEHLRRSATDPLTREPLKQEDLRPNLGLRAACEEFLEENGWAVDY